jgi:putative hydrolase of the HAD superfamily
MAKGRDLSAATHRECWTALYAELDAAVPGIATALYDFEISPAGWSPFPDTKGFLEHLAERDIPVVVISDVAFDLRPIFRHHELDHLVHTFVLSAEHGSVKADGELFRVALAATGIPPEETLMVGDNPANDGQAVFHGIPAILLPLVRVGERRGLDTVLRLIP